ncbi:hypothetical protein [Methanopyrus sp. KOL6]|uniref:hypothetical protein n=1 Tax=Methanopyrus sp. KOL6 TaxID=1937004 RepID=UPI000B4BD51C|nr:hypothetical protein [Methanopyrus sp. KOL6]
MLKVTVCPPCYGFREICCKLAHDGEVVDVSDARRLSNITPLCENGTDRVVIAHMDAPTVLEWLERRDRYALRSIRSKVYNVLSALLNRFKEVHIVVYSQVFLDFVPDSIVREVSVELIKVEGSAEDVFTWPPYGPCPEALKRGGTLEEMEEHVSELVEETGSTILREIARRDVRTVRTRYLSATEILGRICSNFREFKLGTKILDALEAAGVLTSRNVGYRMFSWSPAAVLGRRSELVDGVLNAALEMEGSVFR